MIKNKLESLKSNLFKSNKIGGINGSDGGSNLIPKHMEGSFNGSHFSLDVESYETMHKGWSWGGHGGHYWTTEDWKGTGTYDGIHVKSS